MENTVYDAGKFLEWFEENVTKLDVSLDTKSSLPGLLYHYADFLEKNKPTEKDKRKKEEIISSIKSRIESEHRKYAHYEKENILDWKELAARKIYSTYFNGQNNLTITAVEGDYCAVCGCTEFWNDEEE